MAKKIKVSIQDEQTLIICEDAQKGDLIDLKTLHERDIDTTTINNVVSSIKREKFEEELKKRLESMQEKQDLEIKNLEKQKLLELQLKQKETEDKAQEDLRKKEAELEKLKLQIESISEKIESQTKLKSLEEIQKLEREYQAELRQKEEVINSIKKEKEISEETLKEKLRSSETMLISVKEMRTKMSTKMIGESLELHCENEFQRIRSIAFPNAHFEKDNEISKSGSKGDYIYREFDDNGDEILSIMFEMKNEDETTATKKKNKDFYKELDKDRREKNCEYAVLVSLLEKENELYDDIVTVHEYDLMYAIRPQHFITIIGFLRQAHLKNKQLQKEIFVLKNQNIDVTNFESNMYAFQEAFSRNYDLASRQFNTAIEEIDKTIDHLSKVKENLLKSDNNLRLANNKASDLTIKKLTKNSPSVAEAFENI